MKLSESVPPLQEGLGVGAQMNAPLHETINLPRASALIQHHNAKGELLWEETVHNVITTVGRDFLHTQGYGLAPAANGLNFIGLSNDALTETTASTTLSNEIAVNGLTRAVGAVTHVPGTNTTTISKVFTATGTQSAQKAALFTLVAVGTMNHALAFTQRNLINTDTLTVTFTITLG